MELNGNAGYGILIKQKDILQQRKYFQEMAKILGVKTIYYAPRPDKHWTTYAEIKSNYFEPEIVDCIFETVADAKTMKKLGWNSERGDAATVLSVPYDLKGLQVGALFIVPSPFDKSQGKLFRVSRMSAVMIYPASITCEIVPEYEDTYSHQDDNYTESSMNIMSREEDHL